MECIEDSEQEGDSDVDDIDPNNFKGIYYGDDPNKKYTCPETGAHFKFEDMQRRLVEAKDWRKRLDKELGLSIDHSEVVSPPKPAPKQEYLSSEKENVKLGGQKVQPYVVKNHRHLNTEDGDWGAGNIQHYIAELKNKIASKPRSDSKHKATLDIASNRLSRNEAPSASLTYQHRKQTS